MVLPTLQRSLEGFMKLKLDSDNANLGTRRGREILEQSLREFGAGRSILVDKNGVVIAGNKTLSAAQELGLPVRVVTTDGEELVVVQREDLDLSDGDKARRLAYADNRSSQLGLDWDAAQIVADLEADVDLSGLWSDDEIAELIASVITKEPPEDPGPQTDKAEALRKKWGVETGQIWQVGKHRLMCGDSTDEETVNRLMQGCKVGVVFTDPPYGIKYDTTATGRSKRKWSPVAGDELKGEALQGFYQQVLSIAASILVADGVLYICCASTKMHHLIAAADALGIRYAVPLVWVKQHFALTWDRYHPQHEIIFYGGPGSAPTGKGSRWFGPKNETTVWAVDTDPRGDYQHPTQKPIALAQRALRNSSSRGGGVADLFLGSGSTMAAAETGGRVCYGADIEPKYVAVTLERMSGMGLTPRLLTE